MGNGAARGAIIPSSLLLPFARGVACGADLRLQKTKKQQQTTDYSF
jgi:hypothetical protein